MEDKQWRDEEVLKELYVEEGMSQKDISNKLGCSNKTIRNWLDKFDIKRKFKDKELLQELYIEDDMNVIEIGDELNCSGSTIRNWLDKFNIQKEYEYEDKELLRELYIEKGMSQSDIADKLNCTQSTIWEQMDKMGIETRKSRNEKPPHFRTDEGYEVWNHKIDGRSHTVYVHRLVAVAEYGIDAVSNKDVHHANGVKWDNRHENLIPMTRSDHTSHHNKEYAKSNS